MRRRLMQASLLTPDVVKRRELRVGRLDKTSARGARHCHRPAAGSKANSDRSGQ
jgi:hypothetical protein